MEFLDKDKTMDNIQKRNICTNVPSSQAFRSCLFPKFSLTTSDHKIYYIKVNYLALRFCAMSRTKLKISVADDEDIFVEQTLT
jgi:hypothetical protein